MQKKGGRGIDSRLRQIFLVYQGYLSLLTLLEVVSAVACTGRGEMITHNFIFHPGPAGFILSFLQYFSL